MDILSGKRTLLNVSCFPSKNGSAFKRKKKSFLGNKSFSFKTDLLQKGLV